jgi:hypothetical protein
LEDELYLVHYLDMIGEWIIFGDYLGLISEWIIFGDYLGLIGEFRFGKIFPISKSYNVCYLVIVSSGGMC